MVAAFIARVRVCVQFSSWSCFKTVDRYLLVADDALLSRRRFFLFALGWELELLAPLRTYGRHLLLNVLPRCAVAVQKAVGLYTGNVGVALQQRGVPYRVRNIFDQAWHY